MKKLIDLLQAVNHDDVVKIITQDVDLSKFNVISKKYYDVFIPINQSKSLPLLTAHTDTIHNYLPENIKHKNGILKADDGIGGDDRNGCYIISELMQSNPEDFIFALFDLEERGCIGSNSFMEDLDISLIIGIDRRGSSDIALYGYESDELLDDLLLIDDYNIEYGTCSDCSVLAEILGICCINLSCGFYREHTAGEYIIIADILKTLDLLRDFPITGNYPFEY